jgi:hypothetical protein
MLNKIAIIQKIYDLYSKIKIKLLLDFSNKFDILHICRKKWGAKRIIYGQRH